MGIERSPTRGILMAAAVVAATVASASAPPAAAQPPQEDSYYSYFPSEGPKTAPEPIPLPPPIPGITRGTVGGPPALPGRPLAEPVRAAGPPEPLPVPYLLQSDLSDTAVPSPAVALTIEEIRLSSGVLLLPRNTALVGAISPQGAFLCLKIYSATLPTGKTADVEFEPDCAPRPEFSGRGPRRLRLLPRPMPRPSAPPSSR